MGLNQTRINLQSSATSTNPRSLYPNLYAILLLESSIPRYANSPAIFLLESSILICAKLESVNPGGRVKA